MLRCTEGKHTNEDVMKAERGLIINIVGHEGGRRVITWVWKGRDS